MPRLTLQMVMGNNEQAAVEIDLDEVSQWDEKVAPVLAKLEQRVGDRARRIMAANEQLIKLGKKDPTTANLVQNLVLLAMGTAPSVQPTGLIDLPNTVPVLTKNEEPQPEAGR